MICLRQKWTVRRCKKRNEVTGKSWILAENCKSCHSNPEALGFGKGVLRYEIEKGMGTWVFDAEYELNPSDLLPEDAWIPFMGTPAAEQYSTRINFRPFTVKEQQNILTVGACLECHSSESKVMQQSLEIGLEKLMESMDKNCILPFTN